MAEVFYIALAYYGRAVLGFNQMVVERSVLRKGARSESVLGAMNFPTSWNQIEVVMLVALRHPLLIFAENGVSRGVFERGAVAGNLQELNPEYISDLDRELIRERVR